MLMLMINEGFLDFLDELDYLPNVLKMKKKQWIKIKLYDIRNDKFKGGYTNNLKIQC
jgi:hypothetical protein